MSSYFVKNEAGLEVCTGILQMFYGNLWETTMNRMDRQFDGYIRSLFFRGQEYRVYRRNDAEGPSTEISAVSDDPAYGRANAVVA